MKAKNWGIALLGLWEFGDIVAPFIPGFGTIQAFVWNHILVGLVLMIAGAWAARTSHVGTARKLNGVAAAGGVWLILAPFILGPPAVAAGLWNDVIVGVLVVILSVWAALTLPQVAD